MKRQYQTPAAYHWSTRLLPSLRLQRIRLRPPGFLCRLDVGFTRCAHLPLLRRGRRSSRSRSSTRLGFQLRQASLVGSPHLGLRGFTVGSLPRCSCRCGWGRRCCSHGNRNILAERLADLTQSGLKFRLLIQERGFEGDIFVDVRFHGTRVWTSGYQYKTGGSHIDRPATVEHPLPQSVRVCL